MGEGESHLLRDLSRVQSVLHLYASTKLIHSRWRAPLFLTLVTYRLGFCLPHTLILCAPFQALVRVSPRSCVTPLFSFTLVHFPIYSNAAA